MSARLIVERAHSLGFERVGIIPLAPPYRGEAFERWLGQGMHGEMAYMANRRELRLNPVDLHPGALSVVAVAMSYAPTEDDGQSGGIARYARGRDYHKVMRKRLAELGRFIDDVLGEGAVQARPFVDSAPVLERDIAERAGLGWMGKSTNIIDQYLGSYLFLGELFVGHPLEPVGHEQPDRCGRCTACIDACPTDAIVAPYVVDGRRCISYLTIELKGPIPWDLRPLIGDHLFGCDICQIVCPWTQKAPGSHELAFRPRPEILGLSAADLLRLSESEFSATFVASPIRRTGRARMARNAAVVLGNSGSPRSVPGLIEALRTDPTSLVRGHAAWALGQIGTESALAALDLALISERDPVVRDELTRAGQSGSSPSQ